MADRIGSVVVAALTRTTGGLYPELELTTDVVPSNCVVNFDDIHTIPRAVLRRRVTELSPSRIARA